MKTVTSGAYMNAPQKTSALYAEDGVLWGTVAEDVRGTPEAIRAYFDYFAAIPNLSVVDGSYHAVIQVMGDSAISSGYYTFSYPGPDGKMKMVPARYTFVYRRNPAKKKTTGTEWEIVNHHSSALPNQPAKLARRAEDDAASVDAATKLWMKTVTSGGANNAPEEVCGLYASDAVLWGTVAEDVRSTPASIRSYFDYFANVPGLSVVDGSYHAVIQVMGVLGDTAVSSGYYTFSYPTDDGMKIVPARFTFVYRRNPDLLATKGTEWEIINHHSSALPNQPDALVSVSPKKRLYVPKKHMA